MLNVIKEWAVNMYLDKTILVKCLLDVSCYGLSDVKIGRERVWVLLADASDSWKGTYWLSVDKICYTKMTDRKQNFSLCANEIIPLVQPLPFSHLRLPFSP